MSRPKPDPRANVAAATTAAEDSQPLQTLDASDAALDANGVDTKLKAPTEAVSRETSGIRDEDSQGAHIGLTQGRIVEETDPGGERRRVRILTPTD